MNWDYSRPGDSLDFLFTQTGFAMEIVRPREFEVRPRLLFWPPDGQTLRWWIQGLSRLQPRMTCFSGMGRHDGWSAPLSPNLLARAVRT